MDFGAGADLSWKQSNDRSSEMGTIVISQNLSLDGVVQDPTGEEGYRFGGWFGQVGDRDREEWAKVELDEVLRAEALLLGRRSDAWFAERWLSRTGVWADRLNSMPKYVVSSTIDRARWTTSTNSTVLKGDVVARSRSSNRRSTVRSSSSPAPSSCTRWWSTTSLTSCG